MHFSATMRKAGTAPLSLLFVMVILFAVAVHAHAQNIDTLTFGNSTSENAHSLTTAFDAVTPPAVVSAGGGTTPSNPSNTGPSQTATGGLGLTGRQLLPRTPNADVYGGQMSFIMTVDPVQQNYLTMKFWGSDTSADWLIVDCNSYEVGSRHSDNFGGNFDGEILWHYNHPWYPNRWVYRTVALPLNLTQGQTSVTLTVRSLGYIFFYSAGAYFGGYQKLMNVASQVIYEAVTHTNSYFDSSIETQGTGPTPLTPLTTPTNSAAIASIESTVNSTAHTYITATPSSLTPDQIDYLAQTYGTSWSTYKGSSALVTQVIAAIDALTTAYAAAPTTYMGSFGNPSWGGYFGPVGDAIRQLWPQINTGSTMSTTVAYGGSLGTVSRTAAWSAALRASVDYGRFNRRGYTNQAVSCDSNIYLANRGLELVQSSNSLLETEAVRYLHEAAGISPWLGSDQPGGGQVPVYGTAPNGPNWFLFTTAGLSKETGMVSSDYGEQGGIVYRMGVIAGDSALKARGLVIYQARDYFRYTGTDANGYLIMMGAEPVGDRNGNDMPGHTVYLGHYTADDFLVASQGASAIGANLLGYFQQGVNQGQALLAAENEGYGTTENNSSEFPLLPDYWTAASAQAQTGVLLPQTNNAGLPDFAWADEQDMVISAKHGSGTSEENFYANLNWKSPAYINGYAKVWDLTPSQARDADVKLQDEQFVSSGLTLLGSNVADNVMEPWDVPTMATAGVPFMEAIRSDLTSVPTVNQDGGRGTGYTLRWGHWLVGMNAYQTSTGTTYAMKMPSDFSSDTDLISGNVFSGPITLQPQTAVVFYMANSVDPNPAPGPVLYLGAGSGENGAVPLTWSAAAGANYYTLLRSTTSGGPYTVLANGLTQLQYLDNTVTNGTTYYYVVASYTTAGLTGGNSQQASATPAAAETAGLPVPWTNADVGSVGAAGSATYSSGTFTLKGSGGGIVSTADAFQYVYVPLNGNATLTVKVVSQQNTLASAPAGIMVRQSLNSAEMNVALYLMPSDGVTLTRRSLLGNSTFTVASQSGIKAPYWLQLSVAAGNVFTGSISPDGVTWTVLGTYTGGTWTAPSTIGLVDSSKVSGTLGTDVFSNVTLTGVPTNSVAAVPAGLAATPGTIQASLSWSTVSGATGYNLKRSTASGGPYTTVDANTSTASYIDTSVVAGTTYFYVVSSLNAVGESANSSPVSVVPTPAGTSTTLSSSPSTTTYGATVTLTATVISSVGVPTGTVSFYSGGTLLGTGTLNGSGVATLLTNALQGGTDSLTAAYGATADYTASTSSAVNETVNTASTATAVTSSSYSISYGTSVTLTATVTSGAGTPVGTANFYSGSTLLGTGTLNGSGVATLSTGALQGGTDSVTASYGTTANFAASTSSPVNVTVSPDSTATALSSSATTIAYGTSVTLTATVTSSVGIPTGTATFYSGSTSLGSAALNGSGVATLTTTTLAIGTDSLTASYGTTADYTASTSPAMIETVYPAGTTIGAALTFTPSIINTIVGNGTSGHTGDGGLATNATVTNGIRGIAADAAGDLFFIDLTNYTVRVVYEGGATASALITAENPTVTSPVVGDIYLIAGTEGTSGTPASGTLGTSAKLKPNAGLSLDPAGDIYISDSGTNKVWVIYAGGSGTTGTNLISLEAGVNSPQLGYIYPVAGNSSTLSYAGNGVLATSSGVEFHGINDMKFDNAGNMYIVDEGNCAIREVSASNGYLNTIVGNGTCAVQANNGPASSTELDQPYGIAVDFYGNLYIADKGSVNQIRMVYEGGSTAAALITLENPSITTPTVGNIYAIAGSGTTTYPYGVLGTSAKLGGTTMVALDAAGNIYIIDSSLVDQVNALTGTMTVLAGSSTLGYAGDGGSALSAEMNGTRCVAVDAAGRIYVTDATNLRIRQVGPQGILTFATAQNVGTTSPASTIALNNTGNVALTFSGTPTFSGMNAGDFALNTGSPSNTCNLSGSLAVGASCNLAITFTPTAAGGRSAALTIATNGVSGSQTVSVSGTGH